MSGSDRHQSGGFKILRLGDCGQVVKGAEYLKTFGESRRKSAVIDSERWLLTCMRYIEMNPVRAGMVDDSGGYRWSSRRANACGGARELLAYQRPRGEECNKALQETVEITLSKEFLGLDDALTDDDEIAIISVSLT